MKSEQPDQFPIPFQIPITLSSMILDSTATYVLICFLLQSMSRLRNLEKLDVSGNSSLRTIQSELCSLEKLMNINCHDCRSMTSPPYAVCKLGLPAMRKYHDDLAPQNCVKFVPVTVIGRSMAGKTSLIRSMQANRRVLCKRSIESKLDEATKVFKIGEAEYDETTRLVFHDYGGQTVYQYSYQLALRSKFVPLLVIDIAEFDRLVKLSGEEAACQVVCFDWISQLFISCPQAGRPLVVLTHCDKLQADVCESRWRQLVQVTEALRICLIQEERAMAPEFSSFISKSIFWDVSQPLLHTPFFFSNCSGNEVILGLKAYLVSTGLPTLAEIPESWYILMLLCDNRRNKPYLTLEELDKIFPNDEERFILQYLCEIGRVIWYRNSSKLATIVFHRIELLTGLVELLFDHSCIDAWDQRISNFRPFMFESHRVHKRKYHVMVECFLHTGVMNSVLLFHLIQSESELPAELAVEVLRVFHLICGPIQRGYETSYIIPYFSTKYISVIDTGMYIPHKVELCFSGLALSGYIYHLLTARFVDFHLKPLNHVEVGYNGACIKEIDGTVKYLFHNMTERTITLLVMMQPETIITAWESQLATLSHLKSILARAWKGAHYETVFYCSHCLLTKQATPTTTVDPEWANERGGPYTGKEICVCSQHSLAKGRSHIPLPLLYPC